MKTWLLLGVTVLVGIGGGIGIALVRLAQRPWEGPSAGVQAGVVSSAQAESGGPHAKVAIEEETYDFGVMDSNATGRHEFVFTNVGQGPLTLQQGPTSCRCTAMILEKGKIAPGKSGKVVVTWTAKEQHGDFFQTAEIQTNDPHRPRVTLTVKGRVTVAARVAPAELILTGITAGQPRSATARVFGFLSKPVEITGYECTQSKTSDCFEVTSEPLPPEQVAEEQDATSGCLVNVTVKPGLPVGSFRQKIVLNTNYPEAPTVELQVQGTVAGEISVVGRGWNQEAGVLTLGSVRGDKGLKRELFIRASGPHYREVRLKPIEIYPDLLKVEVGETRHLEGGKITLTSLIIQIPKGSRPANHLGMQEKDLGRIVLETNHPNARQLRILVRFAVEG